MKDHGNGWTDRGWAEMIVGMLRRDRAFGRGEALDRCMQHYTHDVLAIYEAAQRYDVPHENFETCEVVIRQ